MNICICLRCLSVDFAKAFNTVSHQACLKSLSEKKVSDHCIRMTAAFLTERKMILRAEQAISTPRILKGVAPQGTLLGNCLFILATDKMDERRTDNQTPTSESSTTVGADNDQEGTRSYRNNTPDRGRNHLPITNSNHFSTPTIRGQFVSFSPPPNTSSEEDDDSFVFFDPLHKPRFRINDSSLSMTSDVSDHIVALPPKPSG